MKSRVQIHNTKTGTYETKEFDDTDAAFDYYWTIFDKCDPDIEVELITVA